MSFQWGLRSKTQQVNIIHLMESSFYNGLPLTVLRTIVRQDLCEY